MRVVADSHALVWYIQDSAELTDRARDVLAESEASDGIVVSVASLIDLWYVSQTTQGVTADELARLREALAQSESVDLHPVDVAVADAFAAISRATLTDPWDRLIVATAIVLDVPLVTRDSAIQKAQLVATIW